MAGPRSAPGLPDSTESSVPNCAAPRPSYTMPIALAVRLFLPSSRCSSCHKAFRFYLASQTLKLSDAYLWDQPGAFKLTLRRTYVASAHLRSAYLFRPPPNLLVDSAIQLNTRTLSTPCTHPLCRLFKRPRPRSFWPMDMEFRGSGLYVQEYTGALPIVV